MGPRPSVIRAAQNGSFRAADPNTRSCCMDSPETCTRIYAHVLPLRVRYVQAERSNYEKAYTSEAMTRRTLLGSAAMAAGAAAVSAKDGRPVTKEWQPKLGVLGRYTPNNVAFAQSAGFTNMILDAGPRSTIDASKITDAEIDAIKQTLRQHNMHVSAFQITVNHIDPDDSKRSRTNDYFVKAIEVAGKLGVPYIGSATGKDTSKSFPEQINTIVRTYNDKYFRACESSRVRILWEPWPGGPNLATGPVGFRALFKGFDNSQFVGLQYDPSHLVRQFMDPIETAWEFKDQIYDVHLKDTEIFWPILKAGGIDPVDKAEWWTYRIPGMGSIAWHEFFSVLQSVGYNGGMSIEQEDPFYGANNNPGPDFSEEFKTGFIMAKRYLNQYVP